MAMTWLAFTLWLLPKADALDGVKGGAELKAVPRIGTDGCIDQPGDCGWLKSGLEDAD
jgi:hypothetical protein